MAGPLWFLKSPGAAILLISLGLTACATEKGPRRETLTLAAGDAIAANTVMQMVDPWPWYSHHSAVAVPAEREQYEPAPVNQDSTSYEPASETTDGGT